MRSQTRCGIVALLFCTVVPVPALNIILTNDDGFETSNITALYDLLKAAGHDVVITAPFEEQSGRSAYIHADSIDGPLLPVGVGLNVNVPRFESGQGASLR